ncbi:MAG: hypothetical protein AAB225_00095 [Acidobacteriota bacterium]
MRPLSVFAVALPLAGQVVTEGAAVSLTRPVVEVSVEGESDLERVEIVHDHQIVHAVQGSGPARRAQELVLLCSCGAEGPGDGVVEPGVGQLGVSDAQQQKRLREDGRSDGPGRCEPDAQAAVEVVRLCYDLGVNYFDGANRQRSFEKTTLPVARKQGMGVIAMKTLGAGAVLRKKVATVEETLSYIWSLPVSTAILGCDQPEQVKMDARAAQSAKPLTVAAMERLRERVGSLDLAQLEPWKPVATASEYRAD